MNITINKMYQRSTRSQSSDEETNIKPEVIVLKVDVGGCMWMMIDSKGQKMGHVHAKYIMCLLSQDLEVMFVNKI